MKTSTTTATDIASMTAALIERDPELATDFAEALAHFLVLNDLPIEHDSQCRFTVWLRGEAGLKADRAKVAALPAE